MKNENNTSAKKKLIPAIAALATSAVMLSTSTYAWFTMNKTAEVTGLQMSATAGDSLEISLGEISGGAIVAPAIDSTSWKNAIQIGEVYDTVGKLKPASSNNALTLYTVPDADIYSGGTAVNSTATVSKALKNNMANLTVDSTANNTFSQSNESAHEGYFVDIPMWIRTTSKDESRNIYCTVNITDDDNKDLKKAVRVAIIPVGNGVSTSGSDGIKDLALPGYTAEENSATVAQTTSNTVLSGNSKIFGMTNSTHKGKVIGSSGTYSTVVTDNLPTIETAATNPTADSNTVVFMIPADATANSYSGVSFIARVWLEGESTFCSDLTAGQDWNIDFHFSLDPIPASAP